MEDNTTPAKIRDSWSRWVPTTHRKIKKLGFISIAYRRGSGNSG
jgi:hypothetical protein